LESFGDAWSLLIVRDIVFFNKRTFGEFMASDERIASAVLARRLASLESQDIIKKSTSPTDRRKDEYTLTEKGLSLVPLLLDLTEWGATYDPETGASPKQVNLIRTNRAAYIRSIRSNVALSS
jgi:DNA-binding HxlR family transcriptional regulator